ncbi:MAG: hypothetical protein Q9217_005907 [Psora testacea]
MARHKADEEAVDQQDEYTNTSLGEKDGGGFSSRQGSVAYAKLQNPLAGMTYEELMDDVEKFAKEKDLVFALDDLKKGALVSQKRTRFETIEMLSEDEKESIRREKTNRWKQPAMMYYMTILCAGSAIVQGMDQSAVNGAQAFYFPYFSITDDEAAGQCGWWNLLLARFALGFAVGAKSSTTPVYAAECAPPEIRGALAMQWQMWTAFGIMLGFVAGVVFSEVQIPAGQVDSQWRIILGSTAIPPLFVCAQVYLVPESPRWYMSKGRYKKAFSSLQRFRWTRLQAARDLYYIHKQISIEYEMQKGKNLWKDFFVTPRNRRAAQSSFFVMFMQQVSDYNEEYFSITFYTIDTFGRRNLLLVTFPLMGIMLLISGFSFFIDAETNPTGRLAGVATGIYLFMVVYSPGEGPVPFTYSAEAFPLYIREYGMAFATATTWGFNFILSLTWPALEASFTTTGAFGWYAAWNFFGWVFAYFCLPETKERSLEELDTVFKVRTRDHARYYLDMLPWYFTKYVLMRDVEPRVPLYAIEG